MATGATEIYSFPYPKKTDPLNVSGDIQALAQSIEDTVPGIVQDNVEAVLEERMQDVSSTMILNGTHAGISVSYNDLAGTLSFNVNDPIITLAGDVSGSATINNLSNTNITTIVDATSANVNSKIMKRDASGGFEASSFSVGSGVIENNTGSPALRITQSGAGLALRVEDTTNPDSTSFVIDANGNVGIGNNAPAYSLDILGTLRSTYFTEINSIGNVLTLNADAVGSPTSNANFSVERGSSTNVSIRWNEDVDRWQFTNDGTNYENMIDPSDSQLVIAQRVFS